MIKHEVGTLEDGRVQLALGEDHVVTFNEGAEVNDIVAGVAVLINEAVGVSIFDLTQVVMEEFNRKNG